MKIIDLVKKLDRMVEKGHIMEAFEEFFSDDVITHSTAGDRSEGKAQKREFLKGFFANMDATDEVKLHDSVTDSDKSYSAYTFKFKNKQNEMLVWNEVIRRTWKEGQVVDEYYFDGDIEKLKKEIKTRSKNKKEEKSTKKTGQKVKVTGSGNKTTTTPVEKKPIAAPVTPKSKKVTTKKADTKPAKIEKQNLKLVEGIGPKIEQLLNAEGIKTYDKLANAEVTSLQEILTAAGPRFSFHKADTWPQQAKLLAQGKKDDLKKLQDELKGGRKI